MSNQHTQRGALVLAGLLLVALGCGTNPSSSGRSSSSGGKKVIVLGFDGMDHGITSRLMAEGRMPNFSRLAEMGGFAPLETAVPPQSPVAWSNFITGMDAGGHGIFDFVHRDPDTMLPYLSTSRTEAPDKVLKLGSWQFPLAGGGTVLLRRGRPFWEVLEANGVETTIIRMPANFPPSGAATRELSGMGTPDLLGTSGTFSFYSSELFAFEGEDISGGNVYEVYPYDHMVEAKFVGPANDLKVEKEKLEFPFRVYIDPVEPVAKLEVGDHELVLQVGEWSDWVPIDFELIPTQSVRAIVRFYLKQTHPELELYASPLNIDPMAPALPISTPESYAAELAEATGRYYTQEMPEDTKALSGGIFSVEEFLAQARVTGDQFLAQYEYVLSQYEHGLLFYYFGNLDQTSHMLMRAMDPEHPAYDAELDAPFAHVLEDLYVEFDEVVGYTLENMPAGTKLIVMSDHGFTSWRRSFHLNTWLKNNGYVKFKDPNRRDDPGLFLNVDWSRTQAYALGLNGLYINVRGREKYGSVDPSQREALMEEIAQKLLAEIDPVTGQQAVTQVYKREEVYTSRGALEIGPDLQVGYAKGTRGSFESALGEFPPNVITDNTEEWSGDHCMDHEAVPGILLSTEPLVRPAASLKELGASILAEFGVTEGFPANDGDEPQA
jgi:predicted AlkP superfamily phosphohydrolase/phosphomutase